MTSETTTHSAPHDAAVVSDRAWKALGVALGGEGFLDQIKGLFASGDDKDLREEVSLAVAKKGWPLRRLELRRRRLEDAFFDVLREANPLKAAGEVKAGESDAIQDLAAKAAITTHEG